MNTKIAIFSPRTDQLSSFQMAAAALDRELLLFRSTDTLQVAVRQGQSFLLFISDLHQGTQALRLLESLAAKPLLVSFVMTYEVSVPTAIELGRLGVRAVLPPDASAEQIRHAIDANLDQESANMALRRERSELMVRLQRLTKNEQLCLPLLVLGHSNKQIAKLCDVSVRTVENRRSKVLSKLGARSVVELARLATRHADVKLFQESLQLVSQLPAPDDEENG